MVCLYVTDGVELKLEQCHPDYIFEEGETLSLKCNVKQDGNPTLKSCEW